MPADLRAALPAIIADARALCAPPDDFELLQGLAKTLTLVGGPMSGDERVQWQAVACEELADIPADLLHEALSHVRRTCRRASEILPAVIEYVEDLPSRRRARVKALELLADVVGTRI